MHSQVTQENSFGTPAVRILSPEQGRLLFDLCRQFGAAAAPQDLLSKLAAVIAPVLQVKVAFVGQANGVWAALAESSAEPRLPAAGFEPWKGFNRVAVFLEDGVQTWAHEDTTWTLVGLDGRAGVPGVLALEGDWMSSAPALLRLANDLRFAQRAFSWSSQAFVGEATHRLTRTLGRVSGLGSVCSLVLRHVARAVPSRIAAFAVPTDDDALAIVATHGYPLELVERVRITPGRGVIGSVYSSRTPMWVPDVSLLPDAHARRPRYRTNSFVAVPVTAGADVLGVVCVTDRLDNLAFTKEDLLTLRTLTAPASLALDRERAKRRAEAFAQAAVIDPVSGLFNRRHFHERLEDELNRAQRHKTPVALMMIDIDDFKAVNDQFGHLAGDEVIRSVSDILRRSVRRFDLCARFGGEEFSIVMPGSGPEHSAVVAERIRQRIEEFRLEEPALVGIRVTVSIGLSVSYESSPRELIERADRALYTAKRAGKNRVVA
jgi:diguanylate cyclase (GGDEF)-like protein